MGMPTALELDSLQAAIHRSLASWTDLGSSEDDLLSSLLLVQQARNQAGDGGSPAEARRITNSVLQSAIDELGEDSETEATVLIARFIEGDITRQVANKLHASSDQVNRWQRSAIANLTRILFGREEKLRSELLGELEAALPPPTYSQLFGFDNALEIICDRLINAEPPSVIAICGIGGIGKTSLADAAVRRVLATFQFKKLLWLRAPSLALAGTQLSPERVVEGVLDGIAEQLWPGEIRDRDSARLARQIRKALKASPYLLVLDGLEAEASAVSLLEQVAAWADPSKVILTTRARPMVLQPPFFYSLDELLPDDALALLRHQAELSGLDDLAHTGDGDLMAVYDVTGGNPLALKLVASLSAFLPLPQILSDLTSSRPGPIEDLYRKIYWEAWRTLGPEAQVLLQAMPLVAESGALPDQMMAMSGLEEAEFWPALTDLTGRSLIEVQGMVKERRYGIHRLTETFLRTEIIRWPLE